MCVIIKSFSLLWIILNPNQLLKKNVEHIEIISTDRAVALNSCRPHISTPKTANGQYYDAFQEATTFCSVKSRKTQTAGLGVIIAISVLPIRTVAGCEVWMHADWSSATVLVSGSTWLHLQLSRSASRFPCAELSFLAAYVEVIAWHMLTRFCSFQGCDAEQHSRQKVRVGTWNQESFNLLHNPLIDTNPTPLIHTGGALIWI